MHWQGTEYLATIKITGRVGNQIYLYSLTREVHSFLDPETAHKVGCKAEKTRPFMVTIADGSRVECNTKCSSFEWCMGKCKFIAPVRLLKLGGCDMVLGVDLLNKLGPITLDFNMHQMQFQREGKTIIIQGNEEEVKISMINGKQLKRMVRKGNYESMGVLCCVKLSSEVEKCTAAPELKPLLKKF